MTMQWSDYYWHKEHCNTFRQQKAYFVRYHCSDFCANKKINVSIWVHSNCTRIVQQQANFSNAETHAQTNFRNCSDIWSQFNIFAVIYGNHCNLIWAYFIDQGDFLLDLHKCIIRSSCDLHKIFIKSSQDLQLSLKIGKLIDWISCIRILKSWILN